MRFMLSVRFCRFHARFPRTPASVDQEGGSAEDIEVVQVVVGAGSTYRPIARGSHYAVTPSNGTSPYGGYTDLAIIDLETQVKKIALKKTRGQVAIYSADNILFIDNWYPLYDTEAAV